VARTARKAERGPDGRFIGRRALPTRTARQQGVGQLALLTPAIILGLLGFALPVCWVAMTTCGLR
jgi:hypothetical protein